MIRSPYFLLFVDCLCRGLGWLVYMIGLHLPFWGSVQIRDMVTCQKSGLVGFRFPIGVAGAYKPTLLVTAVSELYVP